MGDSAREAYYDEMERARMTPLERALDAVARQERQLKLAKSRVTDAKRQLHKLHKEVARLRREGAK